MEGALMQAPTVGRKAKRSVVFPISIVGWIDLLGYGAAMSDAAFNPLHNSAKGATNRLRRFHRLVSEHSGQHFPSLVINDGAAVYRDLSLRSSSVTYDFLCRALDLHEAINIAERRTNDPGARMVIATGFRMLGRRAGIDERAGYLKSIFDRVDDGRIDTKQALAEAIHFRSAFDVVPQLQANFAFTKAYVAEQGGRKAGLGGPRCFVDAAVFSSSKPPIGRRKTIRWRHTSLALKGTFVPFSRDDFKGIAQQQIRTGLEIGMCLTDDPQLLSRLRTAEK